MLKMVAFFAALCLIWGLCLSIIIHAFIWLAIVGAILGGFCMIASEE